MSRESHGYSEDPESYERAKLRGTRRRTKQRPEFAGATAGVVTAVDRGRFTCDVDGTDVYAVKARTLGRKGVVVGDRVRLEGDVSGAEGALARIVELEERTSVLRRSADDDDPYERVIVANADRLVIVVAAADPEPRHGFVERALVAAYDAGVEPVLCVTKTDLADPAAFVAPYLDLGVACVTTRRGEDVSPLAALLAGHDSVLLGHSGVGKSTLINALVPEAMRATGHVNAVTGRGRHTSTSAVMLPLPGGGWIVDTPGVRSFGLAHVPEERRDLSAWL